MTKRTLLALAALALPFPIMAQNVPAHDPAAIQQKALGDGTAYSIVEDLTTEIGPRLAGTEREAAARAWAVERLKAMGFSNVRIEPFDMKTWVRGTETAEITGPYTGKMAISALGNSASTGDKGLEAEVVYFRTLADLQAAPAGSLKGKIAFVSHKMTRTQSGASYGQFGGVRRAGPGLAAQKGAAAIVIRSVGTDYHRNPHTGGTNFPEGVTPIPAAALSIPDAENLERMIARTSKSGQAVKMKLVLTPRQIGITQSGNVIAEVPGSDPKAGTILVGGHLDSWDLGTGAIDDGAGVAITAAAAKLVMDAGTPKRTIRVVWFGAEEVGLFGGIAYAKAHGAADHVLAMESDFGADRIWQVDFKLPQGTDDLKTRIANALAPLGIGRSNDIAGGGPDVGPTVALGVNAIDLQQDGTDYFDLHHTPDDTLDKIEPKKLQQNVAAWATVLSIVANDPADLLPKGKPGN